jgi:hypothetical protein
MRKMLAVIVTGAGMLITGIPASAHHSFAGTYLEDAPPVKAEGTLKEFLLRNPHSFVIVADDKLKDDKGEPVRWSIEWGAAGQLAQQGVSGQSLKVGDHVIVMGSPGRNATDHRIRLRSIERPSDGFKYPLNGQSFN